MYKDRLNCRCSRPAGPEKEVGIEILLKISREYGRSLDWLLLGTGWRDTWHSLRDSKRVAGRYGPLLAVS